MIYVRDDDVLISSRAFPEPVEKFKQVHRWICQSDRFLHVPGLLFHHCIEDDVPGLLVYPEAIEFIKEETAAGRMVPEIHGWEHVDYGQVPTWKVRDHLKRCKEFFHEELDHTPTKWFTPWGAKDVRLKQAAEDEELLLVGTNNTHRLKGDSGVCNQLKNGRDLSYMEGQWILYHWHDGGIRLNRAIKAGAYGSWAAAAKAEPEVYK